MKHDWKAASREFFSQRGQQVQTREKPSFENQCYVSGRDPRVWSQPRIYEDLVSDILLKCHGDKQSKILEVGCASGFIAQGLAPLVGQYVGIDLAKAAIKVAIRLQIENAEFYVSDGERLSFLDNEFDSAFCYDVFTNFPRFEIGEAIIREMLRVVKPGGRVLVGSIPDASKREQYERVVAEVARDLESRYGPPPKAPDAPVIGLLDRLRYWLNPVAPQIVCYYFNRDDFSRLAEKVGVNVELVDIHSKNPYVGFRFNAIFTKNGK
jgi:ubiquinone/menaquinone biosynthesis C-methylase UbiE